MTVIITDRRQALSDLFDFEDLGDRFRAPPRPTALARLFGGQVVAQALAACQRTVEGRNANSCHAYFVRAGDPAMPIDFTVERDTDGRSFSARRVVARQAERPILTMSASFQVPEGGPSHHFPMPVVPPPDQIVPESELVFAVADRLPPRHRPFWLNDMGFDFRVVDATDPFAHAPVAGRRYVWLKLRHRIGDDPAEHQRLFAYASDLYMMHTGLLPFGLGWADARLQDASLDHAIWFHDPFRIDDWLLYALDSPAAGHARSLGRGLVFTEAGRLVATAAQEGLIRMPPGWQPGD